MLERIQSTANKVSCLFVWLVFVILMTLTLFQVYATVIAVSLVVIENPTLRPTGWNTSSIHGIGRLLWLILGIFWLGWVMFTEGYLREGRDQQRLKRRTFRLLQIVGITYLVCTIILCLL